MRLIPDSSKVKFETAQQKGAFKPLNAQDSSKVKFETAIL